MTLAVEVLNQPDLLNPKTADSRQPPISFGSLPTRTSMFQPSTNDDTAILQTLDAMQRIASRTACDPHVQAAAAAAIAGLAPNAGAAEKATAIHGYVRSRVRFVQDDQIAPGVREVLIEPPRLLTMPQPSGDCDDFTMCVIAMCIAVGVPARVVTVAADPEQPSRFSHVYAEAQLEDGSFLPIDASHGSYAGWAAPRVYRRLPWTLQAPADCTSPRSPEPDWRAWVRAAGLAACAIAAMSFLRRI